MFEAFSDTIGHIYDATVDPSAWQAALSRIAALFDALGASLIVRDMNTLTGRQVTTWDAETLREFWRRQEQNPFVRRRDPPQPGTVETDRDIVPRPDLLRGPWYNEYWRPHGYHSTMFLWLDHRDARQQYLSTTRPLSGGEFEDRQVELAKLLLPHLRRALLLDKRLLRGGLDPEGATDALDALCHAVALIDERGAVVYANRSADCLLAARDGLSLDRGRLNAATPTVTARLDAMLAQAAGRAGPLSACSGTIALPRPSGCAALLLVAVPLRRELDWLRPRRAAVCVAIADPEARPIPPAARLRPLFGLTAAEAEVALLAGADSGREIGERLGISAHTVHTHIARILSKTGAKRQSELVRLLSALSLLRDDPG